MPTRMHPDLRRRDWRADELSALPADGNRYEIVDGALLVTPAPSDRHQDALGELFFLLKPYADALKFHAFLAPTAVRFSARREVQPDLLVLPPRDGRRVSGFADIGRLALAVEILSPSTASADRIVKRRLYALEGVPEYWLIDIDRRLIERWRPNEVDPETLRTSIEWKPVGDADALVIDLHSYFERVFGEESQGFADV